jgi:hypothetical protein
LKYPFLRGQVRYFGKVEGYFGYLPLIYIFAEGLLSLILNTVPEIFLAYQKKGRMSCDHWFGNELPAEYKFPVISSNAKRNIRD